MTQCAKHIRQTQRCGADQQLASHEARRSAQHVPLSLNKSKNTIFIGWKLSSIRANGGYFYAQSLRNVRDKSSAASRPRPLGFSKTRRTRGLVIAVFGRGDVVSMPLGPAMGHEQKGTRPALVLNTKDFNRLGDMLVAPITQGGEFSRYAGFAVSLMGTGCRTQGVALRNKTDCSTSRQEKRKN